MCLSVNATPEIRKEHSMRLLTRLVVPIMISGQMLGTAGCQRVHHRPQAIPAPATVKPVVLARGARMHGANGLVFDGSDQLYVATVLGDEILVVDTESGDVVGTIGANQGVISPDEVAFGPDGSLYWTSFATGQVVRLTPDGIRTSQMLAPGINSITFSDDGRLFVSIVFMGDALYEIDPALTDPPRLIAEKVGFLNGMDWGPDGFLYGAVWRKGEIVRVDVHTGVITTVAGGLDAPVAVTFGSDGTLYAGSQSGGNIFRIEPDAGTADLVARLTTGLDHLACDSHGRLFVSGGHDACLVEILSNGAVRQICPGGMIAPGGVAVVPRGDGESVFVADFWSLREFDGDTGAELNVYHYLPGRHGAMTTPFTVTADGQNLILASYMPSDAVQVFSPETQDVLEDFAGLRSPLNAIRFQNDIVVAELGTSSVIRISSAESEGRSTVAGGLGVPVGLAASDDDLWVSDWATGMVLQIMADGEKLSRPRITARGLTRPEGLALDGDGTLLVREGETGCLKRIDPVTGSVTAVATGLPTCLMGDHPTWVFNGVAVGPSGTIYITSDSESALYCIKP
jgi:sugar lactone lactonase YvrE